MWLEGSEGSVPSGDQDGGAWELWRVMGAARGPEGLLSQDPCWVEAWVILWIRRPLKGLQIKVVYVLDVIPQRSLTGLELMG